MSDKGYIRWYEKVPALNQAVSLLVPMPDEVLSLAAGCLNDSLKRRQQTDANVFCLKSVGVTKVMGLHKAKQKRRDYDRNPAMHQLMQDLSVLSEEALVIFSDEVLALTLLVKDYLDLYQASGRLNSPVQEITQICTHFKQHGQHSTWDFLEGLKNSLRADYNFNSRFKDILVVENSMLRHRK